MSDSRRQWARSPSKSIGILAYAIAAAALVGQDGGISHTGLIGQNILNGLANHYRGRPINGGNRTGAAAAKRAKRKRINIRKHPRCRASR